MDLTVDWSELQRWGLAFIPAAVLFSTWLARRGRERKAWIEAEVCLREGRYAECLGHLGKADEAWGFNRANSTPKTVVKDIDRLVALVEMIGAATAKAGTHCDVTGLLVALEDYRAIFADKRHFKFGSFKLKSEFVARADRLSREIGELRSALRTCYRQGLPSGRGI